MHSTERDFGRALAAMARHRLNLRDVSYTAGVERSDPLRRNLARVRLGALARRASACRWIQAREVQVRVGACACGFHLGGPVASAARLACSSRPVS